MRYIITFLIITALSLSGCVSNQPIRSKKYHEYSYHLIGIEGDVFDYLSSHKILFGFYFDPQDSEKNDGRYFISYPTTNYKEDKGLIGMDVQIDKANLDYVLKYLPPKNKYKLIILEVLEDGNVPRCKIIGFVKYKPEDSGKRPVNKNKAISYKNSKPEALPGR